MIKKTLFTLSLSSGLFLSACSWVQPLPGAYNVALLQASDVSNCTKLGTTTSSALDSVGIYQRDTAALREDLVLIAKNEAVNMRGDTIVALSPIQNGRMEFAIYRCLNK
ncbi:DUF4156 domain-containing protein [Thiomicrorhabdus sp. Kp2]|uniref:DUF4156 domain-containing protein n=1 Tax=Thiomicrorhabdus sp. Kp2 TaxID=1123518 RepID=UPI00040DD990|nr:DUF4156 domain-containing protein [Thiomicrorhabdus sp. Kp2]